MASKDAPKEKDKSKSKDKDKSKVHKLALKGSAKLVAEFFQYSIHTILFQRGVYPAEDFTAVKKYGLNMLGSFARRPRYSSPLSSTTDQYLFPPQFGSQNPQQVDTNTSRPVL
jgi:hypothetical protein